MGHEQRVRLEILGAAAKRILERAKIVHVS